jgi:hypothetical protein
MKAPLNLALVALLASSSFMVSAAEEPKTAAIPASVTMPGTASGAINKQAMSEQMQKMQAAHDKAAAAKTPAERQAAMQEGMQTMKDSLTMMSQQQSAAGCSGMGMGMGMSGSKDGQGMGMDGSMGGMGMMDMMMEMMDQQSSMMNMPMHN